MNNIKNLVSRERVDLFGLVSSIKERTKANGGLYIDLRLEDMTGSVDGKIWDKALADFPGIIVGSLVKVRANVNEWNGKNQLNIQNIRLATEEDNVKIDDFIKGPPLAIEAMMKDILAIVGKFESKTLKSICLAFFEKNEDQLSYFPAAQMVHHAMKGGLLYHIHTMMKLALVISERYPHVNRELLISGTLLHDMGKLKEMASDKNGKVSGYTKDGRLLGHIIQGIIMLHDTAKDLRDKGLELDEESIVLLEHMIASHHYEEAWGALQKPAFLEAEMLHHIDLIDSKINIFENILDNLEEDSFSDSQWSLGGRTIYKP